MYAASYGAQQGAMAWEMIGELAINEDGVVQNSSTLDIMTGKTRTYNAGLYARIGEIGGGGAVGKKKKNIEGLVREKLKMGVFPVDKISITPNVDNNIFQRKITVTVSQPINIPLSGIVEYFGGKTLEISATASAVIDDPTEYIRNIDYVMEWIKRGMEKAEGNKFFDKITDAVSAVNNWMKP